MKKNIMYMMLAVLFAPAPVLAQESFPALHKTVFGILAHDHGPTSDRHEDGIDPNFEIQFTSPSWEWWDFIGDPYPTVGITPNFNGDTSALYSGLTYETGLNPISKNLFLAGSIGIALHDGPLHKNKILCARNSDCGFGWRALPRFSAEAGYQLREKHGVSLFYDHMSHRHILPGENEGIDHVGVRYHYNFQKPGM